MHLVDFDLWIFITDLVCQSILRRFTWFSQTCLQNRILTCLSIWRHRSMAQRIRQQFRHIPWFDIKKKGIVLKPAAMMSPSELILVSCPMLCPLNSSAVSQNLYYHLFGILLNISCSSHLKLWTHCSSNLRFELPVSGPAQTFFVPLFLQQRLLRYTPPRPALYLSSQLTE